MSDIISDAEVEAAAKALAGCFFRKAWDDISYSTRRDFTGHARHILSAAAAVRLQGPQWIPIEHAPNTCPEHGAELLTWNDGEPAVWHWEPRRKKLDLIGMGYTHYFAWPTPPKCPVSEGADA